MAVAGRFLTFSSPAIDNPPNLPFAVIEVDVLDLLASDIGAGERRPVRIGGVL